MGLLAVGVITSPLIFHAIGGGWNVFFRFPTALWVLFCTGVLVTVPERVGLLRLGGGLVRPLRKLSLEREVR